MSKHKSYWHERMDVVSFYELSEVQRQHLLEWDHSVDTTEELYLTPANNSLNELEYLYSLGDFMRAAPGSRYDGYMSLTNTSALGIILSGCGTQAIIQCIG